MMPGMVGGEGRALEGCRVCARTSHSSPMYIVAACPRRFLPYATSCSFPTPVLALSPARSSVRDLPTMESASRRVLRSRIAETPATPPAGLPTVMPSAGTPVTATPSAGTPMPSAGTPMPSAGTPFADSPLVPKAEPDVPPGPIAAPSHDVASPNPPTGDAPEPQPALPPTGDVYLRVSRDALSRAEALAHTPPQSLDPAAKSQLAEVQQAP